MTETRPVPRRESPWGVSEGEHRQPKAHRCNDRAEDVIQACFEGNPFKTVPGPFKLFWQCMRSKPGEEPTQPYTYLDLEPPKRSETEVKLE
ncbi:hexokinase-1 protein [Senna tora]|uniref:Hexokinase-1 protein n=1 Tax=Senna tora TaxID=362788 RepID=A0A834TTE0_9FABA|nr:hexokinase-1 protein [Senna tora]